MEVIIVLLAVLIGWILFRSLGGNGLNIKFRYAPISTQKGKEQRIIAGLATAIMVFAVVFAFINQHSNGRSLGVVMAFMAGALVSLVYYLKRNK